MNENIIKRRNRQIGLSQCILEGMTLKEAGEEYGISAKTVARDIKQLALVGYGTTKEQIEQNKILAYKALEEIERRKGL